MNYVAVYLEDHYQNLCSIVYMIFIMYNGKETIGFLSLEIVSALKIECIKLFIYQNTITEWMILNSLRYGPLNPIS